MSPTDASSRELARFLADELRPALPQDFEVETDGSEVVIRFDGAENRNGTAAILDEDDGRSFNERLRTAALSVISHVQDAVADATTEPWPRSGKDMPLPHTEVTDGCLLAWFGDRAAPVLALSTVDISNFAR